MLLVAYIFTFILVLACAVASKGTTLFVISQVFKKLQLCETIDPDPDHGLG